MHSSAWIRLASFRYTGATAKSVFNFSNRRARPAAAVLAEALRGPLHDRDADPARDVALPQDRLHRLGHLRPRAISRPGRGELLTQLVQPHQRPLDPPEARDRVQLGLAGA